MSNISGSKIGNDLSFQDIPIKKLEKTEESIQNEKVSGSKELFNKKKSELYLDDDFEEIDLTVNNERLEKIIEKPEKIENFSREKNLTNDNRTLETFKKVFLKIGDIGILTKDEMKDYKLLKKLIVSDTKPRELLNKINNLSSKLKTPMIKKQINEYRELNIKNVFNSIELNSSNIKGFIDNFKNITKHDGKIFDYNKNMKGIYTALDSLSRIINEDDSNFRIKRRAIYEVKDEITKFVSKNGNSSKVEWVNLLDEFLGETIKLENDKENHSDRLTMDKLKIGLFSKAQANLGEAFNMVNDFNSKHESLKNFSKVENTFFIEQRLMKDMQSNLSFMDNKEFLNIYKDISSTKMTEFRIELVNINHPLTNSFLEDLNNFEAMVYTELANRTFSEDKYFNTINNAGLGILAESENIGNKKILNSQTDEALSGKEKFTDINNEAQDKLDKYGITKDEFVEYMKSSDLNINVSPNFFLGDNSPFFDENDNIINNNLHIKNIFEISKENPEVIEAKGGDSYLGRRQIAEHLEFPILEKIDIRGVEHDKHPVSAALNVGKRTDGAAGGYGQMFFVLKDSVKDRSTYTPLDSFYTNKIVLSKESISSFKNTISEKFENHKNLDELLNRIDDLEGASFNIDIKKTFLNYLSAGINDLVSPQEESDIRILALKHLSDKSILGNMSNTMNNISNIINDLNEEQLKEISKGIKDKDRINLKVGNNLDYIEAQVHGGIDFFNDVKEIRVNSNIDKFQKEKLEKLAQHIGVEIIYFTNKDSQKEFDSMDSTNYNKVPKIDIQANKDNQFREKELFGLLDKYKPHEETFDKEAGYHGRRHISRAVIFSNILSNILKEKGANIDTSLVFRATALHDSGRENNGVDIYEGNSANNLENYLTDLGVDNSQYLKLSKACIDSDKSQYYETLEMGILKSADSLDISRAKDYDPNYLWFMKNDIKIGEDKYIEVDDELRNKIIEEAMKFTSNTDPLFNIRLVKSAIVDIANMEFSDDKDRELENYQEKLESILGEAFSDDIKDDEIELKLSKIDRLLREKLSEHSNKIQELNQKSSQELFENIEAELFSGKYPNLEKYYDKDYNFSFPEYPDEDLLINNTLENITDKPLNEKITELDKLLRNSSLGIENQKKVIVEINKLITNSIGDINAPDFLTKFKKLTGSKLIGLYSKIDNFDNSNTTTDKISKLQTLLNSFKEYSNDGLDKNDILKYFVDNVTDKFKVEKNNLFKQLSDDISQIDSNNPDFVDRRYEISQEVIKVLPTDKKIFTEYIKSLSSLDQEERTKVLSNIVSDISNFDIDIYNKTELKLFTDLVVNSDLNNDEVLTFIKKLNLDNLSLRAEIVKNLSENNKLNLSIILDYAVQDFISNNNPDTTQMKGNEIALAYTKKIDKAENFIIDLAKTDKFKDEQLPYIQKSIFREENNNLLEFFQNRKENLDDMEYLLPLSGMLAYSSLFDTGSKDIEDFTALILKLKDYASQNSDAIVEYASTALTNFDFDFFKEFNKILTIENKDERKEKLNDLLEFKSLKFEVPEEGAKLNDNKKTLKVINEFLFKEIE